MFGTYPSQGGGADVTEPFLSEVRWVAFNFAPSGNELCNGKILAINQNQGLFALLSTTYGGNGQTTFGLPDLRGRAPIHMGNGHTLGETGGEQAHTLIQSELATHSHYLNASKNEASTKTAQGNTFGVASTSSYAFVRDGQSTSVTDLVGGSQPHNNMQPYLALTAIIATTGIFPSQN
nr:tail fiber protein [Paenibacillus alba]